MKTLIEIDEKTVTIDGVKFVKAEPEFKVGQWVKIHTHNNMGNNDVGDIGRISEVREWDCRVIVFGKTEDNRANLSHFKYLAPATKEEIESHLIKVAKEKGFVYGRSFKSIFTDDGEIRNIQPFNEGDEIKLMYFESEDQLYWLSGMKTYDKFCSNPTIYKAGKWAEILPSKKSLPKTKEEFESFLLEWKNTRGSESIMSFLNQYE